MFFSGTLRSVCWFFAIDLNDLSFSSSLVCLLPYIGPRTDIATQDAADDVGHTDVSWRNGWTDRAAASYSGWPQPIP